MATTRKFSGFGLSFVAVAILFSSQLVAEEIPPLIVGPAAPIPKSDPSTQPILGLRAASNSFVDKERVTAPGASKAQVVFLPEEVVIAAWLKDANFAEVVKERQISTDSVAAIQSSGIDPTTFKWFTTGADSAFRPILVTRDGSTAQVDSLAIVGMTANEVIDLDKRYEMAGVGAKQYALAVTPKYAQNLKAAYQMSEQYGQATLSDSSVGWESPDDLLMVASQRQPILEDSAVKSVGFASFGTIRALNAKEAKLKIDSITAKRHDVYLVELVTTLHDLNLNEVREVFFQAQCMEEDCVAWELAPLKVGVELTIEESAKTPEVTVGELKVGEFYGRTISYKTLRPTITAYGLREDEFSWSLQGDAIGMGSFNFMAAIGVPKGTKQLHLEQSVRLKTTNFLGLEGDWATTRKSRTRVDLRP